MMINLANLFEEKGVNQRDWEYDNSFDLFNYNDIDNVIIGFDNPEHQAKGYFKPDDTYPFTATLFDVKDAFKEFGVEQGYVVKEAYEIYYEDKELLFENLEEAQNYLKSLENTELESIEKIMNDFMRLLNDSFDIKAREEYNNSGEWVSFNIYYNGDLIYDGAFIDTLEDKLAEELNSLTNVQEWMLDEGFKITSIQKVKGFPSWNKSYEVTIEKDDFSTTVEVEIRGMQGRPRNTLNFIKDKIDIDELIDEYNSYCKELI